MSIFKRIIFIFSLLAVAVVNIVIYWNSHLYYQAKQTADDRKKMETLKKASRFYPLNDLVFYELGKVYLDLGKQNLKDQQKSETYLQESIQNFKRSIQINPASYFSHFRLAQTLLLTSYVSSVSYGNSYDEYKKTALLLGHNHRIFFEVGKALFSRWGELSKEERDFTVDVLRKIGKGKDVGKLRSLMNIWEMNVKDYGVMEKILPADAETYRMYARYLGEKSLSLEQRQRILARAELLEFEEAKKEYASGEKEFIYFRVKEAFGRFKSCLDRLQSIKFYQNLARENLIDLSDYNRLRKSVLLNLAKCRLEEGTELKEVKGYLGEYLSIEDKVSAVGELESYLKDRGLIADKLETSLNDLDRLSFQVLLYYKQNRYRDIVKMGRVFQQSFVVIPEGKREEYVKVLQLLGDSYEKVDFIYDAGDFYRKAAEIEPENLETLLRMRRNYERLNEERGLIKVNELIKRIVSRREVVPKPFSIRKGKSLSHKLILDGEKIILDLHFGESEGRTPSLVSVYFNGWVIWEDYLKGGAISLSLNSRVGENSLEIGVINQSITINRVVYH